MKRILAFFFGLVLTLSIARVGNTDSFVSSAHICSSTGKVCLNELPPLLSPGTESPRTNFYAHWVGTSYFYGLNPAGGATTSSTAISVTSTPAVVMSASANVSNNPNLKVWPAGTYRLHLYANMASTPGSVYFVLYAGSTVLATSSTVTVATGSLATYDITVTVATDYAPSVSTDALGIFVYASSASTNNLTIGYDGANSTFLSAPWAAFSANNPLVAGTASPGTSRVPAMSDHSHPKEGTATPTANGTVAADSDGKIDPGWLPPATPYTLPVATGSTLGGVKCGSGITCAGDGTASVSTTTIGAVPSACATTDALIKRDGACANIASDGLGRVAIGATSAAMFTVGGNAVATGSMFSQGPAYSQGYAVCQSNGVNCPAGGGGTGMVCGGTCSTGNVAKFFSSSAMTNASAGTDYLAPSSCSTTNAILKQGGSCSSLVDNGSTVATGEIIAAPQISLPTNSGPNIVVNGYAGTITASGCVSGSNIDCSGNTTANHTVNIDSHYASSNYGPSPGSCSVITTNSMPTTSTANYMVISASVSAASNDVAGTGQCLIKIDIDGSVPPWGTGAYLTAPWTSSYSYPSSASLSGFYVPSNGGHTISLSLCTPSGLTYQCIIQPGSLAGHSASMTTMLWGH